MTGPGRVRGWIRRRPLPAFFLLAFGISWTLNGVVIALGMELSWTRWAISGLLSAAGPAIAAVIVVAAGDTSLRRWARGIVNWRVHPAWYALAIGVPAGISLGAAAVSTAVGGPIDWTGYRPDLLALAIGVVLAALIGGGQEELGWRGFAQPELQASVGALPAALLIGIAWGLWHLPLFFDPLAPHSQWPLASQLAYFVGIVGFSVLLAIVYNGTGGSILLAMVMHGGMNALGALVPIDLDVVLIAGAVDYTALVSLSVATALVTWIAAAIVLLVAGRGLYRDRLSPSSG